MDVQFFLETFDDVKTANEYNAACQKAGAHNFLEDYLVKKIQGKENIHLAHNEQETILTNSGLGVASNSEYYSILPISKEENQFMFYFFTYNIDDRIVRILMTEDNSEFFNGSFQISKNREFKKEFVYNNKPIVVTIQFFDGDVKYKEEVYEINSNNLEKFNNTGFFKWLNKKPKIKLVHIQTTYNDEREEQSRNQLKQVSNFGIEYVLHVNEPYKDLPPKHNCQRPQAVSDRLFTEEEVQRLTTALTPAHYGCFEAFKNAILSEFDDCDFIIVCEGDCKIEVPIEEFCAKVFESAKICDENNIGYFSFGDTKTLEHGWLQSPKIQNIENQSLLFITNHIIGLQCIMFPKFTKKWLKEKLRTEKWDASDMFFNYIFKNSPYKMGILNNRITSQFDGFSLIDKQNKLFH
jgi:hypothetical protein